MTSETISELISQPLAAGLIGYGGGRFLFDTRYANIGGVNVSSNVALGLGIGGASLMNEITKEFTLPLIIDKNASESVMLLASPSLTGIASIGTITLINSMNAGSLILPSASDALKLFALGAVSELGGHYTSDIVKPLVRYLD